MFSSKKDEEISKLKDEVESLESRLKAEENFRIETHQKAKREYIKFLMYKKEVQLRDEEFIPEIARLKRLVASEKRKRINSACANRRRNLVRKNLN